jgi:TonB family protein
MWPVALVLFAICVSDTVVAAQCRVPRYAIARVMNTAGASRVTVMASVALTDLSLSGLVCLAKDIRKEYQKKTKVSFLLFSSASAAEHYYGDIEVGDTSPSRGPAGRVDYEKQLRAVYEYDAATSEEYVAIKPFGFLGPTAGDTRIDLPITGAPHCQLEVNGRCLLALDDVTYPEAAYTAARRGGVTLTATITRAGAMDAVAVADGGDHGSSAAMDFARQALENLKTWHFESAKQEDRLRITYTYEIDRSLSPQAGAVVRFRLPSQVVVATNPRR